MYYSSCSPYTDWEIWILQATENFVLHEMVITVIIHRFSRLDLAFVGSQLLCWSVSFASQMKDERGQHVSLVTCMGALDGCQHSLTVLVRVLRLSWPMCGHMCGGDSPRSAGCLQVSEAKGINERSPCLLALNFSTCTFSRAQLSLVMSCKFALSSSWQ